MTDRKTIEFYNAQTEAYRKLTEGLDNPHLSRLLAALPRGARILDLGCGPGHDAGVMAQAGMSVVAMDASAEMLRQAGLVEGVETRLAAFDALDDVSEFDAVWASFSLLHAPRAAFPGHLAAVHRALKPGGTFVLSMKLGTGQGPDRLGRFYAYYGQEELRELLEAAGFTVDQMTEARVRGMAGDIEDVVTVTAHA